MKRIKIILFILPLLYSNYVPGQIYDGKYNQLLFAGYEYSNFNYIKLGFDYGLSDYISYGGETGFLIGGIKNIDLVDRFSIAFKLDFHAAHLFDLEKSDILLGYKYQMLSRHGMQLAYHYLFNDNFGFYLRSDYYLWQKLDRGSIFFRNPQDKLSFQAGVAIKWGTY